MRMPRRRKKRSKMMRSKMRRMRNKKRKKMRRTRRRMRRTSRKKKRRKKKKENAEDKEEEEKEDDEEEDELEKEEEEEWKEKMRRKILHLQKGFLNLEMGHWEAFCEALGGTGPSGTTVGFVPIPKQPGWSGGTWLSQDTACRSGTARAHKRTAKGDVGTATSQHAPSHGVATRTRSSCRQKRWDLHPEGTEGHVPSFSSSLRTWRRTGCRFM